MIMSFEQLSIEFQDYVHNAGQKKKLIYNYQFFTTVESIEFDGNIWFFSDDLSKTLVFKPKNLLLIVDYACKLWSSFASECIRKAYFFCVFSKLQFQILFHEKRAQYYSFSEVVQVCIGFVIIFNCFKHRYCLMQLVEGNLQFSRFPKKRPEEDFKLTVQFPRFPKTLKISFSNSSCTFRASILIVGKNLSPVVLHSHSRSSARLIKTDGYCFTPASQQFVFLKLLETAFLGENFPWR